VIIESNPNPYDYKILLSQIFLFSHNNCNECPWWIWFEATTLEDQSANLMKLVDSERNWEENDKLVDLEKKICNLRTRTTSSIWEFEGQ